MEIIENLSKLVKPLTPTPSTLRNYNISFFDQMQGHMNVPLILYYFAPHKEHSDVQINIFNHLEISLSKSLVEFYPLAGRYMRHGSFIDCSDQGALYIQAKANFPLSKFLSLGFELQQNMLQRFLPCGVGKAGEVDDPLLSIKVTTFECGGVAIGMCISHKLADMFTYCTFIDDWAARSRVIGNDLKKYSPSFTISSHFSKLDLIEIESNPVFYENLVLKIFSFKGSSITKLRENLMSHYDNIRFRPSKVQLIVTLLMKAFVDMDIANGEKKASLVCQGINLRNILVPKAPENFCGNFITFVNARIELSEIDNTIDLHVLLKLLHDSIIKFKSDYGKALILHAEKDYSVLIKPFMETYESMVGIRNDVHVYMFASWCKFSFHTADFGWGKPVWKSTTNMGLPGVFLMDDEEGDGVEAWVHLDRKRMCELEQNPDIKAYMI